MSGGRLCTWTGYTWRRRRGPAPCLVSAVCYTSVPGGPSGRIVHPLWVIDYTRSPCGRVRVGSSRAPWRERAARVAHLYPPETAYWEDTSSVRGALRGAYVVFRGGAAAGLGACLGAGRGYARVLDPEGALERPFAEAAEAGSSAGEAGFWRAQAALCELVGALLGAARVDEETLRLRPEGGVESAPSRFARDVDAFLAAHVGERLSLDRIARAFGVSPSSLSHRYSAEAERSPMATLAGMRLEMARSLVLRGLKLSAVAEQTSFFDAFHLSRAFSKRFGCSPRAYLAGFPRREGET